MARDLYNRQMYQSSFWKIAIIPIGAIIFFFVFDVCFRAYNEYKFNTTTKEILTETMDNTGLNTFEKMKDYLCEKYEENGYSCEKLSFVQKDDYYLLINYHYYFDLVGSISFGVIRPDTNVTHVLYKAYYNEYKETQVEEVGKEDLPEDLIEEDDDGDIIFIG